MQLRLAVTISGTESEVTTTPFSIMEWERQHKTKMSAIFDTGLGMEDLLYLAWAATKASGVTVPQFDLWARTVSAIRVVPNGDDDRPTLAAASDV